MSVKEMWKSTVLIKIVLVFIGFILFSIGSNVAWTILGSLVLLGCCWFMFRQGQNAGHESCAVTKSIERVEAEGKRADEGLYRQAWSRSNGVKSVFAGALFAYAVNAVYIILSLLDVSEMAVMISRVASWVVTMPYWPVIAMFHETYVALTPDIVIVLMASTFLLPIQIWPAWTQTAFRPVLTVLVPASSLILLAFETVPLFYLQIKQMPIKCKPHTVYI